MINVQRYLRTTYQQGARGPDQYDCWGLVREVLAEHFNVPGEHIPAFGHVPDRKAELTKCKDQIQHHFIKGNPQPGAIACHVRRGILFHVGVVIAFNDGLAVLHTRNRLGPAVDSLSKFNLLNVTEYYSHQTG